MKNITFLSLFALLSHTNLLGNSFTYDRLTMVFPSEISEVSRTEKGLELVHESYKDVARVVVYPSIALPIVDFQARLDKISKTLNKGWTEEKNLLRQKGETSKGYGFAIYSQLMNAPEGKRLRILMGVATGCNIQVVSIYSVKEDAAKVLIQILSKALDQAEINFPKSKTVSSFSGSTQQDHILHLQYKVLNQMKKVDENRANDIGYEYLAKDQKTKLIVRINLQSLIPSDGNESIARWLTAANFGQSNRKRESSWDLAETKDYQLPNGQLITFVGIREKYRGNYITTKVGYMVYGPSWSAFIAVGIEYSDSKEYQYLEKLLFDEMMPLLESIAASVTWSSSPTMDQTSTQYLIKKKKYRYHYEYLSTGEMTFSSEKNENWDFYSDGTCTYKSDSFSAAISTFTNMDGSHAGNAASSLEKGMQGDAWFRVIKHGGQSFIAVQFKNGYSTLNLVEIHKKGEISDQKFTGLSINGKIEGNYYKGKDYHYREE